MEWGPALVGSLSEGIKKSMPQLEAAMRSLASVPASALAEGNAVSNYYNTSDNRVINITVQDGGGFVKDAAQVRGEDTVIRVLKIQEMEWS